ncbi:MAG: nucleoside-diphosphate kinase [Candidatus Adiutricales bacterium]
MEQTLSIIKPDAVSQGNTGKILARIEAEALSVKAMKMIYLTKSQAEGFYAVHEGKPFFESLTDFMSSGPAVVLLLEGEEAISRYRALMGATNPADAEPGTLRAEFASNVEQNAVHGSDTPETAAIEIQYFFNSLEIVN